MVELQILSKVLKTHDYSIISDNYLTADYFVEYADEYSYIKHHFETYKTVPDIATFLEQFGDFQQVDVTETDQYLVDKIREEHLYTQSVPVIKKAAELLKDDDVSSPTALTR